MRWEEEEEGEDEKDGGADLPQSKDLVSLVVVNNLNEVNRVQGNESEGREIIKEYGRIRKGEVRL